MSLTFSSQIYHDDVKTTSHYFLLDHQTTAKPSAQKAVDSKSFKDQSIKVSSVTAARAHLAFLSVFLALLVFCRAIRSLLSAAQNDLFLFSLDTDWLRSSLKSSLHATVLEFIPPSCFPLLLLSVLCTFCLLRFLFLRLITV